MKCDTCGGSGKRIYKQRGKLSQVPCPDCINGIVSCCEGSPRDLAPKKPSGAKRLAVGKGKD